MQTKTNQNQAVKWYAIQTRKDAEFQVFGHLERAPNIEGYLPLRWVDNKEEVLFRGYVFAKHDFEGFHWMKYKPGVKGYVRFGRYPTPIPENEIELVKKVEKYFYQLKVEKNTLIKGTKVKIIQGVLAGREGVLAEDVSGKKVALEIKSFGHSLLVKILLSDVLAIDY